MANNKKIKEFVEKGVAEGVYPGAVLLIAKNGNIVFFEETGHLTLITEPVPMKKDSIFDLASLTKPLGVTPAIMRLVEYNKIDLDQPLSEIIKTCPLKDKKGITLRQLLCHSAGFADWKPFYLDLVKHDLSIRKSLLREMIVEDELAYRPGKDCVYSDLGFMLIEWVIEEVSGTDLNYFMVRNFFEPLALKRVFFNTGILPRPFKKDDIVATEDCAWRKRMIQGETDDENGYSLGGYSGHAGLFGAAEEIFIVVNMLREHFLGKRGDYFKPETVREFFKRQGVVRGCTWALGWDTPSSQGSSSGRYFSSKSVGHLGFTGTSIWMDLDKDIVIIFLTNRVHPTRDNQKIKIFRPALHDTVMEEIC